MTHQPSSTEIYFTSEYGRFHFLKGNRDVNEPKIKRMIKVIQNEGYDVLRYAPIIVDENMTILDGQHRYMVCQQLKRPVHYVMVKGFGLEGVARINSNSSNWKTSDYLNSYVDLKKEAYLKIKELCDKYTGLTPTVAASLIHGHTHMISDMKQKFADGLIEVNYFFETEDLLDRCKEFTAYCSNPFSRRFIETMLFLWDNGKYDHERMLRKLEETDRQVIDLSSKKVILNQMEEIINHKTKERVLIH